MKDHEKRELVSRLAWIALEYGNTQQLRTNISREVLAGLAAVEAAERERCARIVEAHRVPVGNSAAGELAAEWTMDALREVRDAIRGA
jgi:hypothetical protein